MATAAVALSGCGGGGGKKGEPIPARQAEALLTQLDAVADRSDRGLCGSANTQVDQLEQKVDRLSRKVSADVRRALADGLVRLRELVNAECAGNRPPPTETTPPTDTTPPPTDTQPPPTDTQPPPTDTTPPPTDTQPPPTDTQPPPAETTPPLPPGQGGGAGPGGGAPGLSGRVG